MTAGAIAGVIAGCGGGSTSKASGNSSASGGATGGQKTLKLGVALFGAKNDRGFNEDIYHGVVEATKQHPNLKTTAILENRDNVQNETDAVDTLAPINNVMLGGSTSFGPVLDVQADKFPNTYFLLNGYTKKLHKNVTGIVNDYGPANYVAGVVAATLTKTNVIGFIGGVEIPPTTQALAGFTQGAKSVNPNVKILKNITGSFADVSLGKAAAAGLIADHADVLTVQLDAGTVGSYQAAKASGKNPIIIKVTTPDCSAYGNMAGTALIDDTAAMAEGLDRLVAGTLKPGAIFIGAQDPKLEGFQLCPGTKYAKDAHLAKVVSNALSGINSGKIKITPAGLNPRPSYAYRDGFDGKVQNAGRTG